MPVLLLLNPVISSCLLLPFFVPNPKKTSEFRFNDIGAGLLLMFLAFFVSEVLIVEELLAFTPAPLDK